MTPKDVQPLIRKIPAWLLVGIPALALRLPLLLLPGAGPDEAAYFYWARSGEPAYAPLMLALVRLFSVAGLPGLLAVRLPSILGGLAVLLLLDLRLRVLGAGHGARLLALATLAFTPWQIYVGAILHPDTLYLAALLFLVHAAFRRHLLRAALAVGLAVLAKPTGLILLPLAAWLGLRAKTFSLRRRGLAAALVLGLSAPVLLLLDPAMIREMSAFARMDPSAPLGSRIGIATLSLLFEGGLLLPLAAWQGFGDRKRAGDGIRQTEREPVVQVVALGLMGVFLAAALFNGQFKGSWYLPPLLLLWPQRPLRLPRVLVGVLLSISICTSLMMVLLMTHPGLAARLEARVDRGGMSYSLRAGTREVRVSATRTWAERLREYQEIGPFADQVAEIWRKATGRADLPAWIIADTYGLAAQLAYHWRRTDPGIVIPSDGLFRRDAAAAGADREGGILILGVQSPVARIGSDLGEVVQAKAVPHPVTGDAVSIGLLARQMEPAPRPGFEPDRSGGATEPQGRR